MKADTPVSGTSFEERLDALTRFLAAHRPLWEQRPFVEPRVSWEGDYPAVAAALKALPPKEVDAYLDDPGAIPNMPPRFEDLAREAARLSAWPTLRERGPVPPHPPKGVTARKWGQIVPFANLALELAPPDLGGWVDWCSGKGHLARRLAKGNTAKVVCLEKDPALCASGRASTLDEGLRIDFERVDVLETEVFPGLGPGAGVAALHACGALNQRLLEAAVATGTSFLAVAPCCYQRIPTPSYRPMSVPGKRANLDLSRHHLRLASFDEVTSSHKRRTTRRREQSWRLGFDLLQRDSTGRDEYAPVGPVPTSWLRGSFERFCEELAAREEISLPPGWSPGEYEAAGEARLDTARALGLMRGLFRRSIESWLVLDRILFLTENGYRASAGTFCDRGSTPRNIAILATRSEEP